MSATPKRGAASGCAIAVLLATLAGTAIAQTPASLAMSLQTLARAESSGFVGFSVSRGEQFFRATHGNEWSCATCHTENPLGAGRHAKTGKPIAPLAPAANTERFTDAAKSEKWFRRNCNDVVGRPCTTQEKGDVLAYLMSLKR